MAAYWDKPKNEILKRVGSMAQIAGATRYFLADGHGQGVECVDVRTGSGFAYTVMPGRGMDIGRCEFKGMPLAYLSKVGICAPAFFSGYKDQWRQCFPGGLLSTCGLSNVGSFCEDETEGVGRQDFGQHGRISNQNARNVSVCEEWEGDSFVTAVSGAVTEAQLRAESFSLRRTVTSRLGETRLTVEDVITNEDFIDRPCMYLYHMNFGYPVLDRGSAILFGGGYRPLDAACAAPAEEIRRVDSPVNGRKEALYFFRSPSDHPVAVVAILNPALNLLAYIRYSSATLPRFTLWKMLGEADYVTGLEAGNCIPKGRKWHRENGMLPILEARASVRNHLEIGVVEGEAAIAAFIEREGIENKQ